VIALMKLIAPKLMTDATAPRPRQAGAVRVEWAPSPPWPDRMQVRDHMCACTYSMFELCTAGGLWFVRHRRQRTARLLRTTQVGDPWGRSTDNRPWPGMTVTQPRPAAGSPTTTT
jgi:hypothetical protein